MDPSQPLTYKTAGVDIDEGARLVELIGPAAKSTARAGADASLGGFAAAFDLKAAGYTDPILLTTTDGVGTKLKVAIESGLHETIGVDLVAMCVNDLLAQGGEPLLFLDYYATGKLDADQAAVVIRGIAEGCRQAGCALAGGETAEMPGLYRGGDYDLAGFAVGAAERGALLPAPTVSAGDAIVAIASASPHANGYSLIRRIVERTGLAWDAPAPFGAGALASELLAPTRIYVRSLLPLIRDGTIKGLAHITGGGLVENPSRSLPRGSALKIDIDWSSWERPAVFEWLVEAGSVPEEDARRTFNLGVGMTAIVAQTQTAAFIRRLDAAGERAFVIGEVRA